MLRHETQLSGNYECPEISCGFKSSSLEELMDHRESHKDSKILKCSCGSIFKITKDMAVKVFIDFDSLGRVTNVEVCDGCGGQN